MTMLRRTVCIVQGSPCGEARMGGIDDRVFGPASSATAHADANQLGPASWIEDIR